MSIPIAEVWVEKLTPIEEVKKIPKGITKLINLFREWVKGNGKTYGKTGIELRNKLKKIPDLVSFMTHLDMSGTERVARIEIPFKKEKRAFFLKRVKPGREIKTLEVLRETNLTGKVFGHIPGSKKVPDFIVREFVPGIDYRALDLSKIPKSKLIKIARSLGKKLRKFHEFGFGLASDTDIIFDLNSGNIYFVDFDLVRILHKKSQKFQDILRIHDMFSQVREKDREFLWKIFLNSYGKEFLREFTPSRLGTISK